MKLLGYKFVLVPININSHWVLFMLEIDKKKFTYYDSVYKNVTGKEIFATLARFFDLVVNYFYESNILMRKTDWSLVNDECPQQDGNDDCGVFVCKFMEYLSRNQMLNFKQEDIKYFRILIGVELIKGELLTN